jgi:hypothetical protein
MGIVVQDSILVAGMANARSRLLGQRASSTDSMQVTHQDMSAFT